MPLVILPRGPVAARAGASVRRRSVGAAAAHHFHAVAASPPGAWRT